MPAYWCMYTFRQVRDRDSLAVTNSDAAPPYSVVLERSEDSLARRRLLDRTPMVGPFNTYTVHGSTPQADYRFELTEIDVEPQVLAPWLMRIPQIKRQQSAALNSSTQSTDPKTSPFL